MKNVSLVTRWKDGGSNNNINLSDNEKYSLSDRRINDDMIVQFTDLIRINRQLTIMF